MSLCVLFCGLCDSVLTSLVFSRAFIRASVCCFVVCATPYLHRLCFPGPSSGLLCVVLWSVPLRTYIACVFQGLHQGLCVLFCGLRDSVLTSLVFSRAFIRASVCCFVVCVTQYLHRLCFPGPSSEPLCVVLWSV